MLGTPHISSVSSRAPVSAIKFDSSLACFCAQTKSKCLQAVSVSQLTLRFTGELRTLPTAVAIQDRRNKDTMTTWKEVGMHLNRGLAEAGECETGC